MRESGSGAMEDRETVEEYSEVREIDSEFEIVNEYNERNDIKETTEYIQTIRLCSETNDKMVHMIKMNIKLPNPTVYDG
eukprot:232590-Amphidinium_carterae.1